MSRDHQLVSSAASSPWTPRELWEKAVVHTRTRSPTSFDQWFAGIQFDDLTDGVLSLTARDEFVLEWVRDHFVPTLTQTIRDMTGWSVQVAWSLDPELSRPVCERPPAPSVRPRPISVRTPPPAALSPSEPPVRLAPAPTGMNPKQIGRAHV